MCTPSTVGVYSAETRDAPTPDDVRRFSSPDGNKLSSIILGCLLVPIVSSNRIVANSELTPLRSAENSPGSYRFTAQNDTTFGGILCQKMGVFCVCWTAHSQDSLGQPYLRAGLTPRELSHGEPRNRHAGPENRELSKDKLSHRKGSPPALSTPSTTQTL